jgi:hypothetical protein
MILFGIIAAEKCRQNNTMGEKQCVAGQASHFIALYPQIHFFQPLPADQEISVIYSCQ